jgi:hypothetical protein
MHKMRLDLFQGLESDMESVHTVSWVGMDGSYNENEIASGNSQRHAVEISELGGHSISIIDENGCEIHF